MSDVTELQVDRGDYRRTRIVTREAEPLAEDQARFRIERFALTSNNVTYAVAGDTIGYWRFFPREGEWGVVPVWGIGVVEETRSDLEVGEAIYGYFPMASEAVMEVGRVKPGSFTETSKHRAALPPLYNNYRRLAAEPGGDQFLDERCLYFPLFMTSYAIADWLLDNDMFGAEQVVIGSVSSKTGLGVAKFLRRMAPAVRIVGLTSPANVAFVEGLESCDLVLPYGREADIPADMPTAYVDMSGNAELARTLHHHFEDSLVLSSRVGATHWEGSAIGQGAGKGAGREPLPGAKPEMFFAPSQILKRETDWGPGKFVAKAGAASLGLAQELSGTLRIDRIASADALAQVWGEFLDNAVPPTRAVMVAL